MSEPRRIRHLNLVIVPRIGRSFFNVVISHKVIYVAAGLLTAALVANAFFAVRYLALKRDLREKERLVIVSADVKDLQQETEQLKSELDDLRQTSERIEEKTGISTDPGYTDHYDGGPAAMPSRAGYDPEVQGVRETIRELRAEAEARSSSALRAERKIDSLADKFASIPSIWPVRGGRITSAFGYRVHPISRGREFHRGLDIKGYTTTPIYVTADGVVTYSGWYYGYGNLIVVNHGNGFETWYGHNSRNLARPGERVSKRQIIGYVGDTGTTTGSHVHYEVHYEGTLMNPQKFLTLSIREADRF